MNEYKEIAKKAIDVAEQAAAVAQSYFRKALLIETKEDQSPVTVADRKTEQKIREDLKRIFPEHGIIGEEFGTENGNSDFTWTVDPIDGTRSFIRGIPLWGTLLGLIHRQKPVIGIMVLPGFDETYVAIHGSGAYCNGARVHVSATQNLGSALVACGDFSAFEDAGKKGFYESLHDEAELVRGYTDCFGHSMVIRGSIDAMVDPIVAPWDVVPIACLVKEAGGEFFGFEGEASFSDRTASFISCTPALKKQLLQL